MFPPPSSLYYYDYCGPGTYIIIIPYYTRKTRIVPHRGLREGKRKQRAYSQSCFCCGSSKSLAGRPSRDITTCDVFPGPYNNNNITWSHVERKKKMNFYGRRVTSADPIAGKKFFKSLDIPTLRPIPHDKLLISVK